MIISFLNLTPKNPTKKPTLKNPFCNFGKGMGFLGLAPPLPTPPPPPHPKYKHTGLKYVQYYNKLYKHCTDGRITFPFIQIL